jgi:membrane protease YdiL (CAAX protease family)
LNIAATLPIEKKRWGLWATLRFSVIIIVLDVFAQGLSIGMVAAIQSGFGSEVSTKELLKNIETDGFLLAVGTIASAWVGTLVIAAIVLLRKGISFKEYLAIKDIPLKEYVRWFAIFLVFILSWEGLNVLFDQPVSDWMMKTYQTAQYLPLLWVAIVIAAPLVEELFFRGFLFEGLRESWMGPVGAVLVTSIFWASIHVQYNVFQMVMIGFLGVLLGIAKIKTRSLYITLAMHSLLNLIAMVQVSVYQNS